MDPLDAQIRQVFVFDTPDLRLNKSGVVVRAGRVQGRGDVTVVKLRPNRPRRAAPAAVGGASHRGGEMSRGRREGHHDEARALRWQ
jgi:hypothetical protein